MSSNFWDKANSLYNAVGNFAVKRSEEMQEDFKRKLRIKSNDELKYMAKNMDDSSVLKPMIYEEMRRRGI